MNASQNPDASLDLENAPRPRTPTPRLGPELLDPYVPGRRAGSAAASLGSNEFPLGPSELVRAAVGRAADEIHRYLDPLASERRSTLALEIGSDPDEVLIGNGSDELIYLLVMAYVAGGTAVCAAPPYRVHPDRPGPIPVRPPHEGRATSTLGISQWARSSICRFWCQARSSRSVTATRPKETARYASPGSSAT